VLSAWATRLGPPSSLEVVERPTPQPGKGEVLVRVGAASVNFPDVLMLAGQYQVRVEPPFAPGSEFAGEVVSVGPGVPHAIVGTSVLGAVLTGAFAEYVAVPAGAVTVVPDGLDHVAAAAFGVAHRTAFHALVTIGGARSGDVVVVLGAAGGVGLATVDVATALGMRVIAAASSPERLALTLERGAVHAIDYDQENLKERIKLLTEGRGADVVVDPVGGRHSEAALRALTWGGRHVSVGFASGEIPRIPLNLVLLKGAIVRGFELRTLHRHLPQSTDACERALAEMVASGLRPHVSRVYRLDEVATALEAVAQRRTVGKVVIRVQPASGGGHLATDVHPDR
jgi:NADPH:quinone reductase